MVSRLQRAFLPRDCPLARQNRPQGFEVDQNAGRRPVPRQDQDQDETANHVR